MVLRNVLRGDVTKRKVSRLIIEVGASRTYEDLLRDKNLWLRQHQVHGVIVVKLTWPVDAEVPLDDLPQWKGFFELWLPRQPGPFRRVVSLVIYGATRTVQLTLPIRHLQTFLPPDEQSSPSLQFTLEELLGTLGAGSDNAAIEVKLERLIRTIRFFVGMSRRESEGLGAAQWSQSSS